MFPIPQSIRRESNPLWRESHGMIRLPRFILLAALAVG